MEGIPDAVLKQVQAALNDKGQPDASQRLANAACLFLSAGIDEELNARKQGKRRG